VGARNGLSDQRITRRRLLEAGAVAGAGAVLARVPGASARSIPTRQQLLGSVDVAVVGAGLAGLTAALEVRRGDRSVAVLEARDRVGGRVLNHVLPDGAVSERGGTFVGPTQSHIRSLARQLGVDEFPTYDEGDNVYTVDGTRLTYSDTGPAGIVPPDPLVVGDAAAVVTQLDQMSTSVPVDAPWEAASAADWDNQTLESWVAANSTYSANSHFQRLTKVATRAIFGAEPAELSLLFALFYIAASGDENHAGTFERNFNTRDGAQMFRYVGGSQLIPLKMADQLGDRVEVNAPVRRIVQSGGGCVVHTDRGRLNAKRVIVAVPPTLAGRIRYTPQLPSERDQLTQRLPQGTLTKVAVAYDSAFWRDDGLTGQALILNGPIGATFDDSPPGGTPGIIFGFVGGDAARSFSGLARSARRLAVLDQLAGAFGPKARQARDYFETDWSKEHWSRGCPTAIPGPGLLLTYGPSLRQPIGRIHWAGTETSTYWNGYMDGAVRSGERAAQEVLDEL
jgi:monoamine oxidase